MILTGETEVLGEKHYTACAVVRNAKPKSEKLCVKYRVGVRSARNCETDTWISDETL